MAQFRLQWINDFVVANSNAIGQRAGYRQKSVGGIFVTTGFTPSNDLPKSAIQADTPILLNNILYEFRVEALCTENGPTANDNGIQEGLVFQCITPSLSYTHNEATIEISLLNTDIQKARISLKKSSDNSEVAAPLVVDRVGNTVTRNVVDLIQNTNYYWVTELLATVGGVEVVSSDVNQLGAPCPPATFKTNTPPTCDPVITLTATSIEIL